MDASWDAALFDRTPLFATVAEVGRLFGDCAAFPSPEEIDARLSPRAGIRFVRQAPRPRRGRRTPADPAMMYDARITEAGEVPTRADSWHDLMNALVWGTFPVAKRALHARQHRLVTPGAPHRSRTLDALALVDEGGVVVESEIRLSTEAALHEALDSGHARLAVFGHAIYEGLALGWPAPIASVVVVPSSGGAGLDATLAEAIEELSDPRELLRLPILDRQRALTE